MTVAASHVLAFDDAATNVPAYKITVTPSSPIVGDAVEVSILSAYQWTMTGPYGGLHARTTDATAEQFTDVVSASASGAIATTAPVAFLISAVAATPIVQNGVIIAPAGDPSVLSLLSAVSGRLMINSPDLCGSISVVYTAHLAQRWKHDGFSHPGEYCLEALLGAFGITEDIRINVGDGNVPGDVSQPSIVIIGPKSFCTSLPVPGSSVYVDGTLRGVSDPSGNLVVGLLAAGSHTLKIVSPGFIDTDADDLSNDSFVI